ncbi:MAG: HDOD domain-containing protein [Dehalococcoidia bacterium]|nr:MAG: HDOD domain-containing protein [Dehalococcoidia bacterium]
MIPDLMKRLENAVNFLPPIPVVVLELLQALDNENVELNALSRIISKDPSMSVNVLKVANSAFYRLPYNVSTVEHAVRILGIKEITMICIACGAYRVLKTPRNVQAFDSNEFWKHSVATGVIARRLCVALEVRDQTVIYLSGLLHDIGKIILDRFIHDIYKIVIQTTCDECISMIEAEKRYIGESHDTVGGWFLEKWKLPAAFIDVARYHHSVTESPEDSKTFVAISSLADHLARLRFYGFGGDMSGVVIGDTDAFKILEKTHPAIADMDVVKFIWDLEDADDEIIEMEGIFKH